MNNAMKKICIIGAAGFIGTNLSIELKKNKFNKITLVDRRLEYFVPEVIDINVELKQALLNCDDDFSYLKNQDILYHLVSTTIPAISNRHIVQELQENVIFSSKLLDAAAHYNVKKIIFISSGGTVYGKDFRCPLSEETPLNPISSYGLQKVMIEKLLYLYHYIYGLDYRIIRLSNPYGPYQRPNGMLGVITTFIYKALNNEKIEIYGDGSIIRDFIYISDAIKGIINIADTEGSARIYNLGSGKGTSIKKLAEIIKCVIGNVEIIYKPGRDADIPVNFLDIKRFERDYGKLKLTNLKEGIKRTAEFLKRE